MISENIQKMIGDAMKAREEIRLSTLRMLSSALNYERIALQHDLTSDEELKVVQKEAKKRRDAIEAYEKAGALDRAEKEKKELEILTKFLPEQMTDADLAKIIDEVIAETGASQISDMGRVIGAVVVKVKGAADGKRISELVKASLIK